ncbi:MAG TPA: hypothetical protein VF407_25270, partial [Polyangiaceae bacterium]
MRAPRNRALFAVVAAFALFCIAFVVLSPRGVNWSVDSCAKLLAVKSLRFDGHFHYDVPYLGRPWDPGLLAVPVGETFYDIRFGEIHISWPELFPLLVWPFYRAFGWLGLYVVPLTCGAASVYLCGRIAETIRSKSGWIAALVAGSMTPVVVYSTLLWEHTPALALMLGAVLLLTQFLDDGKWWRVAVASGAVGLAAVGLRTDVNVFFAALV